MQNTKVRMDYVRYSAVHSAKLLARIRVARMEMEAASKPAVRDQVKAGRNLGVYVQLFVSRW